MSSQDAGAPTERFMRAVTQSTTGPHLNNILYCNKPHSSEGRRCLEGILTAHLERHYAALRAEIRLFEV